MFTKSESAYEIDYIETANNILVRLEMEYKYAVNKSVDKAEMVKFLAEQLTRMTNKSVLCWNDALNTIADNGSKHPPTIPEITMEMRRLESSIPTTVVRLNNERLPYSSLWANSTDDLKITFYERHNALDVTPATKWVSREYYEKAGWSKDKIRETLGGSW